MTRLYTKMPQTPPPPPPLVLLALILISATTGLVLVGLIIAAGQP